MNKYKIIALYGESGSGKDTLLREAIQIYGDKIHKIVGSTTRPPRTGEEDGIAYHFLTNEEFTKQILNQDMFEAATFRGWCYGTNINDLSKDKINIGVFNTSSLDIILNDNRFEVVPIYIEVPAKERIIRALNREDNPDINEIFRRYQTDTQDFKIFFNWHAGLPDRIFKNENIAHFLWEEKVKEYLDPIVKELGQN